MVFIQLWNHMRTALSSISSHHRTSSHLISPHLTLCELTISASSTFTNQCEHNVRLVVHRDLNAAKNISLS
jgi:hypothetical protein